MRSGYNDCQKGARNSMRPTKSRPQIRALVVRQTKFQNYFFVKSPMNMGFSCFVR